MVLDRPGSGSCGCFHAKMRGTRRNAKSDRSKPALLGVRGLRRGGARCPGITSGKGHPDMRRSHPPPCARWPGTPGPGWLTTALGFWSGRALATGTALVGLCLIHHHPDMRRSFCPRGFLQFLVVDNGHISAVTNRDDIRTHTPHVVDCFFYNNFF